MLRTALVVVSLCLAGSLVAHAKRVKSAGMKPSKGTLPVTTSSAQARDWFEKAMVDFENFQLDRATQGWRDAAKADSNFALAHAWIAFSSTDPTEVGAERERAKELASKVTPGEQLMIQWVANVQENNFVAGIAAMNDMLAMYPKDTRLLFLVSNWLLNENENEQTRRVCERALRIDKNYPAALNNAAYAYARLGNFPQAFAAMERYIKVLPNEPNPQDSYAEIRRMSGNFDGALEHYRAALKIDPTFHSSQVGLGDTYALMGDEARARREYAQAIEDDPNEANRLNYGIQSAMSWVRENNFAQADKAFIAVAEKAHSEGLDLHEARAYRFMAMYQIEDAPALSHLEQAEAALTHQEHISRADREEERAQLLRLRAVRAVQAGNQELADMALQQLQAMAKDSRSTIIQQSYHAAAGALLVAKKKYKDAISDLQEDSANPFSLQLLSRAYSETGAGDDEHTVESKLRAMNTPTMEQALVVIAERAKLPMN